jgi:hypothetical protein
MTGTVLEIRDYIVEDQLGCAVARKYVEWFNLMAPKRAQWQELRKYLFATDTTQTTNSKLPWKNKTTVPKLTQIRDNLFAQYMAITFPKRKSLDWLSSRSEDSMAKKNSILAYMYWASTQPEFKSEIAKCILDYIDYGNVFSHVEWLDQSFERDDKIQSGFIGPSPRRISPLDIVFNPTAPSFLETPKIIRSMISMGELKKKIDSMSTDENHQEYVDLFNYLTGYRERILQSPSTDLNIQDSYYSMDGFANFRQYLEGDYVEVLTFYGDMFDYEKKELLENHVIMVVDRHKVISKKPNPSYFGYPPIFHVGWRIRQDNLWAMGPLDNLVGMQYRLDHVENLKADVFDLIAFPVLKIKGYVNDFEWGPMQRIVTDNEGDVEMLAPPFQVLQVNNEIQYLIGMMEEMAGAPKEAMGFRTPGEKTAFEVQRLENAGTRIFTSKSKQFDEMFMEPIYNAMLEMAKRQITGPQEINVFDDEFNLQTFMTLTADDITGAGRIKPLAARHFAEKAEIVQNISSLYSSGIAQDQLVSVHISGFKLAKLLEEALDLQDYGLVQKDIRISEQVEAERLKNAHDEQTQMQAGTPAGLNATDHLQPDVQTQGIPVQ